MAFLKWDDDLAGRRRSIFAENLAKKQEIFCKTKCNSLPWIVRIHGCIAKWNLQ
jgi:hypothetical protein